MKNFKKETANLVTFTEETLNGKLHFLSNVKKHTIQREFNTQFNTKNTQFNTKLTFCASIL